MHKYPKIIPMWVQVGKHSQQNMSFSFSVHLHLLSNSSPRPQRTTNVQVAPQLPPGTDEGVLVGPWWGRGTRNAQRPVAGHAAWDREFDEYQGRTVEG